MKILFVSLIVIISFLCTNNMAYALEKNKDDWYHTVQVEGYNYRYNEKNSSNDAFLMRDKGMMYGVNVTSEKTMPGTVFDKNWSLITDTSVSYANDINYKSDGTGESDDSNYLRIEIRLLGKVEHSTTWDIYSGIGIRSLHNNDYGKTTSTGHHGYYRHSRYVYIPLGVVYKFPTSLHGCKTQSHLEYDLMVQARQYSGINEGLYNRQKRGLGLRAGIDLIKPDKNLDWIAGIFVRHWAMENSEVTADSTNRYWLEPKNKTFEVGAKVGMTF